MDFLNEISEDEKMVQYYVYLEALRRLKEEENDVKKSLALKVLRYQDSLIHYLQLYQKYVNIVELMETHNILNENHQKTVEQGINDSNINRMIQQLKSNMNSEKMDSDQLAQMKEFLGQFTDWHKTKKLFQNTQLKISKTKGIDQSLNRIEADTKTGMDILVTNIMESFHKVLNPLDD